MVINKCIFCDSDLSEGNLTLEHIIPNALGGRIKTKNSTCTLGHAIDTKLIQKLSFFAIALDVPRERSNHPDFLFNDASRGLEYKMSPGKQIELSTNLKVTRDHEGKIEYRFYAPNKKEAERILKKNLPKKRAIQMSELEGNTEKGAPYQLNYSAFDVSDLALLQGIAKIALCYSRSQNISESASAISRRFLRGESVPFIPVASVGGDVLDVEDVRDTPLTHGIYLISMPSIESLFCYVVLFEAFEFIVLIDDNLKSVNHCSGYRYDLVTAGDEARAFRWIASHDIMLSWIRSPRLDPGRISAKFNSLKYWLEHQTQLWIERAIGYACRVYWAEIKKGHDVNKPKHLRINKQILYY